MRYREGEIPIKEVSNDFFENVHFVNALCVEVLIDHGDSWGNDLNLLIKLGGKLFHLILCEHKMPMHRFFTILCHL